MAGGQLPERDLVIVAGSIVTDTVLAGRGGQSPSYTDEQIGENAKRGSYVAESAD